MQFGIELITNPQDFLTHREMLDKTPLVGGMTHWQLLAGCLSGQFKGMKLVEYGMPHVLRGIVVYQITPQRVAQIVVIYCPGYTKNFRDLVVAECKKQGATRMTGVSVHTDERTMHWVFAGLKHTAYMVYEVEL